jgi:hypothetical protein
MRPIVPIGNIELNEKRGVCVNFVNSYIGAARTAHFGRGRLQLRAALHLENLAPDCGPQKQPSSSSTCLLDEAVFVMEATEHSGLHDAITCRQFVSVSPAGKSASERSGDQHLRLRRNSGNAEDFRKEASS